MGDRENRRHFASESVRKTNLGNTCALGLLKKREVVAVYWEMYVSGIDINKDIG